MWFTKGHNDGDGKTLTRRFCPRNVWFQVTIAKHYIRQNQLCTHSCSLFSVEQPLGWHRGLSLLDPYTIPQFRLTKTTVEMTNRYRTKCTADEQTVRIRSVFSCFHIVSWFLFSKSYYFFEIPPECQTIWIHIRPDILSGLIWVQSVCKGYQQTIPVDKELRIKLSWAGSVCCSTRFPRKNIRFYISRGRRYSILLVFLYLEVIMIINMTGSFSITSILTHLAYRANAKKVWYIKQ